ncbi:MAG TPA: hypothetical protein VLB82_07450 [Thermodesulfobacteriota bacterium]|nr:hypothetical protein [Thermodesulfobacteriota bacterium]
MRFIDINIRAGNIVNNKKYFTILFSALFLFSLFIHTHPLSLSADLSFESNNTEQHLNYSHNSEFCSACRADGKIYKTNKKVDLNLHTSILLIKDIGQSYNDLHFKLLNESRAPPVFS